MATKPEVELGPAPSWLETWIKARVKYPETIWVYDVPPAVATTYAGAALAAGNPIAAFSLLPLAPAYYAYLKAYEAQVKLAQAQKKLKPFIAPGPFLEEEIKEKIEGAVLKLAFALPALAVKPLVKGTYTDVIVPGVGTGKYTDFRLAHATRAVGARFASWATSRLERKAAIKGTESILAKGFTKAGENLKPFYNRKTGRVDKKRRSPWGIILGFVVVDVLGTAIGEMVGKFVTQKAIQGARWARVLRAIGKSPTGRVAGAAVGGVFSLNTAAGGALGFAVGGPAGAIIGAGLGSTYQTFLNLQKWATDVRLRVKIVEAYGKPGYEGIFRGQPLEQVAKVAPRGIEKFAYRIFGPASVFARYQLLRLPLKGFAVGFILSGGNPIVALQFAALQYLWSSRVWAGGKALGLTYEGLKGLGLVKDISKNEWLGKGIADAKGLYRVHWTRNALRATRGGLVGAAIAFPFALFGVAPWWVVPAAFGTGWLADFAFKAARNRLLPAGFGPYLRRFPYWKGTGAGFLLSALLAGLGVPPAVALGLGMSAGIGGQILWKRTLGQIFGKGAAKVAAKVGVKGALTKLPLRAIPVVGWVLLALDVIRAAFPFAAELLDRFVIQKIEAFMDKGWWAKVLAGPTWFNFKLLYWSLKGTGWVVDKVLWPIDKAISLFFDKVFIPYLWPLIAPIATQIYLGAYAIGKTLFGWTTNLPGFLGDWARGIGGAATGIKNAITGGIKAAVSAILGLLGAIISLLTGGDIAEAAIIGAIGLALGGAVLNAQTIESAFFREKPGAEAQRPTPFASLSKNAETQNPHRGPSPTVAIGNDNLPQQITFHVRLVAQNNLSNLSCSDELILIKEDGGQDVLPIPPIPLCPETLAAGAEFAFSFNITALNEARFRNSIVKNTFEVNGRADVGGAEYWIPMRDTSIMPFGGDTTALENFKNFVRSNFPNNLIDANCFGQSCWDFVVAQSQAAGVNPAFVLAVWYEESHFSDVGNHFSCPVGIVRPHTPAGLRDSLNCFLTQIVDGRGNDAEGFIAAMHQYCGTGIWEDPDNPTPLCHNNPNFLNQLRLTYEELGGTVFPLEEGEAESFGTQAVAIVVIGSPPNDLCSLFSFGGDWTVAERALIQGVCLTVSTSPQFVSLVRNVPGGVILERVPDGDLGAGVCGAVNGANTISIACTFGNQPFANYVIIHELGHVIGNYNTDIYNNYSDTVYGDGVLGREGLLPTYPFDLRPSPNESFAEMIADNVVYRTYNFPARDWSDYPGGPFTNYPTSYPLHYNFAKQQIFGGVEF